MSDLDSRRAAALANFCIGIIDRANAALPRVTGLAGPEGPEPVPVSSLRAASLPQEQEASDER